MHYLSVKKADYHLAHHDDVYQFWVSKFPNLSQATTGEEFIDNAVVIKDHHVNYEVLETFSDNILLEFSLIIGTIHIAFALLRYSLRNWAGFRLGDLHGRGLHVFPFYSQSDLDHSFSGNRR